MPRLSSPIDELGDRYEVVVIGSGYGGAIAASRLSRAGRQVCVLERGREFQPGEYPDTEIEALHQMQVDSAQQHVGSRTGLYDLRLNDGITVFQGISFWIGPFSKYNSLMLGAGVLIAALGFKGGMVATAQRVFDRVARRLFEHKACFLAGEGAKRPINVR